LNYHIIGSKCPPWADTRVCSRLW